MTDNPQPEAIRIADEFKLCLKLDSIPSIIDIEKAAAELRRQRARITELESQLAQRFDAADMATASAQGAGMDKQIETKMIENTTGSLAVCLDKDSKFNGWMFSKHPDGKWVTKRLALPKEIKLARDKLERLEISEGIPCRG